ncbi:hypothetical protein M758_3G006900 [Ceratodon purpureus]|nr:hypothetical protein M758_3G006900 [Ceratodon purpureus]
MITTSLHVWHLAPPLHVLQSNTHLASRVRFLFHSPLEISPDPSWSQVALITLASFQLGSLNYHPLSPSLSLSAVVPILLTFVFHQALEFTQGLYHCLASAEWVVPFMGWDCWTD